MLEAAQNSGANLLGDTPLGRVVARLPLSMRDTGWRVASKLWASGAAGTVGAYLNNPSTSGYFQTQELPALLANPNVFLSRFLPF